MRRRKRQPPHSLWSPRSPVWGALAALMPSSVMASVWLSAPMVAPAALWAVCYGMAHGFLTNKATLTMNMCINNGYMFHHHFISFCWCGSVTCVWFLYSGGKYEPPAYVPPPARSPSPQGKEGSPAKGKKADKNKDKTQTPEPTNPVRHWLCENFQHHNPYLFYGGLFVMIKHRYMYYVIGIFHLPYYRFM